MSWPSVKLRDCCEVVGGATPKRDVPEYWDSPDVPWVTPKDVSDLDCPTLEDAPEYISEVGFKGCSTSMLPKGSVLVTSRAPIGNIAIAGRDLCTNQGFKSLIPGKNVDGLYLYYCMKHSSQRLQALGNGATFKEVSKKIVEEFEIPLPPLPEQKRIAAILDKADAVRRKRQQAIQLADDFLRAVFLDMFGDPVTNPKGWDVRAVKEMAKVTTGNTPPRDKPEYYGDFIEWIKSDNINTPSNFLTVATEYLSEAGCIVGRRVPAGSTLLTCIAGSFDCIGNSAYADREVSFNQQINALTPKSGVNGIFLYALAKYCKKAIQAASTGGMKGMVSKGKLEEVRFICPPESMQQKFAEAFHRYQGLRKGMEHSLDGLSHEFSSISQKAFSGHL